MQITILAALMTATLFGSTALAQPAPLVPASPAPSFGPDRAAVVAVNEGNVEPGMVNSLVQLLSQGFNAKGISIVSSPELASPVVLDDKLGAKAAAAGANRIFVLHILRLNFKTLLQVEERAIDGHTVYLTSLVPGDVENSNEILPRLADAVVRRVPATDNAEYGNVTGEETGSHNRSHFVLGVPGGSVAGGGAGGIEAGYQFETSQFALGVSGTLMAGSSGTGLFVSDVYGHYYFLPGSISPYVGAGMGFGGTWNSNNSVGSGSGALAELEAGVEILRFHHTHFDIAAQAFLPFYNTSSVSSTGNSTSSYEPDFLGTARIVF
jgi:hypothetical protein